MIQAEFQNFINNKRLCTKTNRILLGVSGGTDSVCMFHLFRELGYSIGIAHCNFQLRGEESNQDEAFVKNLANEYNIPLFTVKFNTEEYATKEGISIQMAARNLRYKWFEEVRNKHQYDYIAIAHNRDDVVETFLINLTRGSGIKGFTGIKEKTVNIIRPIIFASRKQIEEYLQDNNYSFREDSTNSTTKYSRNLIRHEVIPLFEQINPSFKETIIENISKLRDIDLIYNQNINTKLSSLITEEKEKTTILLEKLKELNPIQPYLYEYLKQFGFSETQVLNIIESFDNISGKQFFSSTHRVIKDRNELIIEKISTEGRNCYHIEKEISQINNPLRLDFISIKMTNSYSIEKSPKIGLFDMDKLNFPLILRKWKKGDYFMPLGMKNLKKLSDFFIDNKFTISDKENTWILESDNKIVWIIGKRIDDRFKINQQTKNILKVKIVEN